MDETFDEGQYWWDELQEVPSYCERFDPRQELHMVYVTYCASCGNWHNSDDACPTLVEVAL